MRCLIVTQNESLYLPNSFAVVCRELGADICGIVSAPAMSTHGGAFRGFWRHLRLFGLGGTIRMVSRLVGAKLRDRFTRPGKDGPFYSIPAVARAFDVPYFDVDRLSGDAFFDILDELNPELLISISCPQIIGKKIRARFPKGCINVHGAPLPKYRGLMPAFWALKNNETTTAATVHDLESKIDNGAILHQTPVEITPDDTWDSLVRKTKASGARGLVEVVRQIEQGTETRRENRDEDATYFSFPTAADRKEFRKAGRRFL